MTPEMIALIATSLIALAAVGKLAVDAATGKFSAEKGEREVAVDERQAVIAERSQAIVEAETTTGLLREQVEILRQHRDEREAEIKAERIEFHKREEKLEARVLAVEQRVKDSERDYRALVLTITTMGLCIDAATCKFYNPGDRRTHPDAAKDASVTK